MRDDRTPYDCPHDYEEPYDPWGCNPCGPFLPVYAGVVTSGAQTVQPREAVQFTPPITEIQNVGFNGTDLFTILIPGNYFCMGYIAPAPDEEGPVGVLIGLNGPDFGLFGSNYGTAAGQQVVCFGFTGHIPAGTTLGLYNTTSRAIRLGNVPGRMAIFRIS